MAEHFDSTGKTGTTPSSSELWATGTVCEVQGASRITEQFVRPLYPEELVLVEAVRRELKDGNGRLYLAAATLAKVMIELNRPVGE